MMRERPPLPILLYSANTWLAYIIAEQYYAGYHYIWCTRHFDPSSVPSINYTVPPSSSPAEIYRNLQEDVKRGDKHSAKIAANKAGILRGMEYKKAAGEITEDQATDIASIVAAAEPRDFRPLIFVIPFGLVQELLQKVPISQRAHPLSIEFTIDRLPRDCFDVIDFDGR
jgi:hypothetical protein